MTENREPNTASSKYKRQIRIAITITLIIQFIVVLIAIYKLRR